MKCCTSVFVYIMSRVFTVSLYTFVGTVVCIMHFCLTFATYAFLAFHKVYLSCLFLFGEEGIWLDVLSFRLRLKRTYFCFPHGNVLRSYRAWRE